MISFFVFFQCCCIGTVLLYSEGEDYLPSSTEETQVSERSGSGHRWSRDWVPQAAGSRAAEHDWWADTSEYFSKTSARSHSSEHQTPIISFFCTFQDREKLLRKKRHKRSRPIKVSVWFSQLAMFPSKVGNWTCAETVSIPCVQEKHSFYPMCSREAQFLSHVFKRTKSSLSGKLAQNISKLLQMEKPATLFSYIINNLRLRARRWNTQ